MTDRPETASQTAGPYVHIGCTPNIVGIQGIYDSDLGVTPYPDDTKGDWITIEGQVFDGAGDIAKDALLEFWQANPDGSHGPGARGFARVPADLESGLFRLRTLMPGATGGAPHIAVWLVARGINIGLQTRIYFADTASDPVLSHVPEARRSTLIAKAIDTGLYRFDIHLQGPSETVFFDF